MGSRGSAATEPRIRVERLMDESDRRSALYDATFWSLREQPKELPAVWLYDERGSELFERITQLPEYYLSRSEREILAENAVALARRTDAHTLVELGSGSSEKTRILLDALHAHGTLERFVPLDASETLLRTSAGTIAERYPGLGVHAIVGDFERHLGAIPAGEKRLIAFLGSTVGNLYPSRRARLFATIAAGLAEGDAFLLGVDLVKDSARIEAAYNDGEGTTELFLRNGLDAVNRELGANLDQRLLAFEARWDAEREWMDIGFRARAPHATTFAELDVVVPFAADEQLRVEVSAKFRRETLERELDDAGLQVDAWWTNAGGEFALLLASRSPDAPAG